jgi:RNA polymerase sigma factor (sigma-70 family)
MTASANTDIDSWIENATRHPVLAPDVVLALSKKIQSLPEDSPERAAAVNKLVMHNLRLVIHFVKRFMSTSHKKWGSPETVDYLQTGAIGLHRAAQKFDPTLGYSFSTYANCWIRSTVSRYNMKTITPVYVSESMSRQIVFYNRNGFMQSKRNRAVISEEQCQEAIRAATLAYECVSLDIQSDSGNSLVETIPGQESEERFDAFLENAFRTLGEAGATGEEIYTLIGSSVENKTMQQIADELGETIHRVKLFKKKAINKARRHREQVLSGIL